jgi:hypothetical protein
VLHMEAVLAARRLIAAGSSLKYFCVGTRHLFHFPGRAMIRFKKLDTDHLARNFRTPTSDRIYRQEGLIGFEPVPWLHLGLIPNQDWTDFSGIYLTHPKGPSRNNWVLDVTSGIAKEIDPQQTNFDDAIERPTERRFRARRDESEGLSDVRDSGV